MSGIKRGFNSSGESSNKRVRFGKPSTNKNTETETDFEFEYDVLEGKKFRRGAVNTDAFVSDDEEAGEFSSDSDDGDKKNKKETPAEEAFDGELDMFGGEQEPATKDEAKINPDVDIIGEDFTSFDKSDSEDEDDIENGQRKEGKISAFNMKQEMEVGSLDDDGNYVRNKVDPMAFRDKWMEGISRTDINQAKAAMEKREREEALREAAQQSSVPQTQTDIYRELVNYLRPEQSVQEVLSSLASSLPKKVPAWKQKMLDKKNRNKKGTEKNPVVEISPEEEKSRRLKVEVITGLADQMMALGHFGVYDDTFEIMVRHLRKENAVPQDWLPESAKE